MSLWEICLVLSIVIFIGLNLVGFIYYKRCTRAKKPFTLVTFFLGVTFFAIFIFLFPLDWTSLAGLNAAGFDAVFMDLRSTLQVFSLDGEYINLYQGVSGLSEGWREVYRAVGAFFYLLAPILLVSFIISLFQSVFTRIRLFVTRGRNIYVFSILDSQSLILAESCIKHDKEINKKSLIVFTDVYEEYAEESSDLVDEASRIDAVCTKSDILDLNVDFSKKKGEVWFFIFGHDTTENIRQTLKLMEQYGNNKNMHLYILVDSEAERMIIESAMDMDIIMDLRCINPVQSVAYSFFYNMDANQLYTLSRTMPDGQKIFSVVLVGFGTYGQEFLRTMVWYAQVPDIRLQVHVFERDPMAEQKFAALYPELMSMNHKNIEGDSHYDIWFHHAEGQGGIDVETVEFNNQIQQLNAVSMAFVMLGDDDKNLSIAIKLRRLIGQCFKVTPEPVIEAVIFDPNKRYIINNYPLKDYKGESYNIEVIGDQETTWSYSSIIQPELEKEAKERHLKWLDVAEVDYTKQKREQTKQFYQYEYFRKSSMSSVIRKQVRIQIKLPGADKNPSDRTEEEKKIYGQWEHIGWNAYMRSEGYCYAPVRNDLSKCHNLLVPYDELPSEEKVKDND